jgi:hypothetical protein
VRANLRGKARRGGPRNSDPLPRIIDCGSNSRKPLGAAMSKGHSSLRANEVSQTTSGRSCCTGHGLFLFADPGDHKRPISDLLRRFTDH